MENKKNENSLMDLWDNIKDINTCVIRVPEEEKRKESKYICHSNSKLGGWGWYGGFLPETKGTR